MQHYRARGQLGLGVRDSSRQRPSRVGGLSDLVVGVVAGAVGLTWIVATSVDAKPEPMRETQAVVAEPLESAPKPEAPVVPPPPVAAKPGPEAVPAEPVSEPSNVPKAAAPARTEPTRATKTSRRPKSPAPSPNPEPPATTVPAPSPASTLAEETRLLEAARASLRRSDTNAALSALDDYDARFDRGLLRDEARSTRLKVLCTAGRGDDARALAERYAPGPTPSRWDRIVTAACGGS